MSQMTPEEVEAELLRRGENPEAAAAVRAAFERPTEEAIKEAMRLVFRDELPNLKRLLASGAPTGPETATEYVVRTQWGRLDWKRRSENS